MKFYESVLAIIYVYFRYTEGQTVNYDNEWNPSVDECPKWELDAAFHCSPMIFPNKYNISEDIENIHAVLQYGIKNNLKLINIITKRTVQARSQILEAYKLNYDADLVSVIKQKLSGRFRDIIIALMKPTQQFYADELKKAIPYSLNKYEITLEILGTFSNKGIHTLHQVYESTNNRTVEEDLFPNTVRENNTLNFFMHLAAGRKNENTDVQNISEDVEKLIAAENENKTDCRVFEELILKRNVYQLRAVFAEFKKRKGYTVKQSLIRGTILLNSYLDSLRLMCRIIENRAKYFAKRLHSNLNKNTLLDFEYNTITRIIVGRSEIDLLSIKAAYIQSYGSDLEGTIREKIIRSSEYDYRETLINMLKLPI